MSRDALVIGINIYDRLNSLKSPSEDAEAIAQLLTEYGDFRVRRLPAVKKDDITHVGQKIERLGQKTKVTLTQLEEALVQLFKPEGENIPDTGLLFFSGHGLRKDRGVQEGFLASSDVNPDEGNWGVRLKWLRDLLQESPIRQQIVWLDCCYSGELLNFKENLKEADPGNIEKHDRFFIAASREYEVAYEETAGHHGILTGALLQALDPRRRSDALVTNFTLTDYIEQALKSSTQRPLFANSGNKIILTGRQIESARPVLEGVCPYKGLAYFDFNNEDPKYFYGRKALTDDLLDKVDKGNFLAVLGASGSGKSSVVRAGLLHQLKLGQRLSSSNQWPIYIFRPREHPLQSLAEAFLESGLSGIDRADQLRKTQNLINSGAIGLGQLITASQASRVVLVVDQFEECFTLCRDSTERQQFFECLLGAVERSDNKLYLVLTMRADFFGKCLEQDYAGLAKKIQENLVAVTRMNWEELEQAITEPAKQVGLEVEGELVTQMIRDVEGSPGSLPLLQYTLTELWKQRAVNWLTLSAYNHLGGVKGTLQKRADQVYESLSPEEREAAKRIFLELTQLGEGTEDTRRQVHKRELVTSQQSQALVDQVIQRLSAERLVVTSELVEKGPASVRVEVVDVAHEALIRNWPRLHKWIEDNRDALRKKRNIDEDAEEWQGKGKPNDFLLRGSKLAEAESFLQRYADSISLSSLTQEFIQASQAERDRLIREEEARRQRELDQERKARKAAQARNRVTITSAAILVFAGGFYLWQRQQSQQTLKAVFLSGDTPPANLATTLPSFIREADKLRNSGDRGNIELALAYYRKILEETNSLLKKVEDYPELLKDKSKIEEVSKKAESSLSEMIKKEKIPNLIEELMNQKFGKRIPYSSFTDSFQEGALKTTYEILMRDAGADLDGNGKLDDEDEANQIPCATLAEIEKLWRQFTNERCGWYGPGRDEYSNDSCKKELDGNTLAATVFYTDPEVVLERFDWCSKTPRETISAEFSYQRYFPFSKSNFESLFLRLGIILRKA